MWCVARFGIKRLNTAFEWLAKMPFSLVGMHLNGLVRKAFLSVRLHSIQTLIWHLNIHMACKWGWNGMQTHKQERFELYHLKGVVKKTATYISQYWKLTMKLKLEKNIHIKNFDLCVTYHESFMFLVNCISFDTV